MKRGDYKVLSSGKFRIFFDGSMFIPQYRNRFLFIPLKWRSFYYEYGDGLLLGLGLTERSFKTEQEALDFIYGGDSSAISKLHS